MPWPLPSAKNHGHDATMRGFRTELHALEFKTDTGAAAHLANNGRFQLDVRRASRNQCRKRKDSKSSFDRSPCQIPSPRATGMRSPRREPIDVIFISPTDNALGRTRTECTRLCAKAESKSRRSNGTGYPVISQSQHL